MSPYPYKLINRAHIKQTSPPYQGLLVPNKTMKWYLTPIMLRPAPWFVGLVMIDLVGGVVYLFVNGYWSIEKIIPDSLPGQPSSPSPAPARLEHYPAPVPHGTRTENLPTLNLGQQDRCEDMLVHATHACDYKATSPYVRIWRVAPHAELSFPTNLPERSDPNLIVRAFDDDHIVFEACGKTADANLGFSSEFPLGCMTLVRISSQKGGVLYVYSRQFFRQ
jgi:hypothetical protein